MSTVTLPATTTDPGRSDGELRRGGPLTDAWIIALRFLTHWRREPARIVWGLAFPVTSVLLFGYVFGGSMTVPGGASSSDYREFLLPGLFAMTMVFGIGETVVGMVTDAEKGVSDRFRSMPMAPSAVVVGRSLAEMLNSLIDLALLLVCGLVIGWRWHGSLTEALLAMGLLLMLRFSFLWVGMYLGLAVRSVEAANNLYALLFPVAMVANTFASPTEMPAWLGTLAEWNPLSSTAAATRDLFGSAGAEAGSSWVTDHALLMATVWPLALVAVFLPLTVRRYQNLSR